MSILPSCPGSFSSRPSVMRTVRQTLAREAIRLRQRLDFRRAVASCFGGLDEFILAGLGTHLRPPVGTTAGPSGVGGHSMTESPESYAAANL